MIKIEKTEVHGFDAAIRGMRNPLESWEKKDSYPYIQNGKAYEIIGPNDLRLMKKLSGAGSDHGKFMRMITVTCDITAPLYWWKEFDTYKVGTVANSCSTMHKIQAHEFTEDMFSIEHLDDVVYIGDSVKKSSYGYFLDNLKCLNFWRNAYLEATNGNNLFAEIGMSAKDIWWQMIQLLPTSYNQKRTVQLNYQVLKNIYHARRNHKLGEWHGFCDWIKTLPESELITEEADKYPVSRENLLEFTGQLLDIFEDFLEEKGVEIENPEREGESAAILYGSDYGNLQSSIEETLINWGVVKEHEKK